MFGLLVVGLFLSNSPSSVNQYSTPEDVYRFKLGHTPQYSDLDLPTRTYPLNEVYAKWKPKKAPLMTRWAKDVTPENVHQEYPRPQLVRPEWINLNGLWDFAIRPNDIPFPPDDFDGQILVPFPVESALSGVMTYLSPREYLWYRKSFTVPRNWSDSRILLHFQAVDWETNVAVNSQYVGSHKGGYQPFTFDITDKINWQQDHQEIVVSVWDPTDSSFQPRGKQVLKPSGIYYTASSGIWQTVWLEPVNKIYITSLKTVPDVNSNTVSVTVNVNNASVDCQAVITVYEYTNGSNVIATGNGSVGSPITIKMAEDSVLWTPESPILYPFDVQLSSPNQDKVSSYFGLRTISLKVLQNVTRVLLNGKETLFVGPLDQGFWPDGIYTPPTDEAMRNDILTIKRYGFNMVRKHVKVEPARYYHYCDKHGLVVMQDMPSGDRSIGPNDPDIQRSPESAENFFNEWKEIIQALYNFPSIVTWITFNEGWGQFNTSGVASFTRELDPNRLLNSVTGWADRFVGDYIDLHIYSGPEPPEHALDLRGGRAAGLGEFGGLGLIVKNHSWNEAKSFAYQMFNSTDSLTLAYVNHMYRFLRTTYPPVGFNHGVYTELTDVETEVTGLMTYDREVFKVFPNGVAVTVQELKAYFERRQKPRDA